MSHTYTVLLVHCVFSTKHRRNLIPDDVQPKLWSFVGGIARKNRFKALVVGGTADHMHALLSLPATISIAKAVQVLKGASSHWMNQTVRKGFEWQEGYGAFTIGISQKPDTVVYIQSQQEHHRKRDFQQEFLAFLTKHGVEYDSRYVLGELPTFQASLRDAWHIRNLPGAERAGLFSAVALRQASHVAAWHCIDRFVMASRSEPGGGPTRRSHCSKTL